MDNATAVREICEKLRRNAQAIDPNTVVTKGLRGATIGHLNKYLGGDPARHAFTTMLFNEKHSAGLKDAQIKALYDWMELTQDDGQYIPSFDFLKDCAEIRKYYNIIPNYILIPGLSILDQTCDVCGRITPHLYIGIETVCLVCNPDRDYRDKERLDAEPD